MTDSLKPLLIAVDGGGTQCRFALSGPQGSVTALRGSANVHSNRQAAIATLQDGIADLAAQAGLDALALRNVPIYAGLAGVTGSRVAAEVAAQLPSGHVLVEDDRTSAVVGALGARDGSLLGIGTGSFLARQTGATVQLIGGYGALLGDEASGGWLGKLLLQRALHVLDGLAPCSDLLQEVLAEFHNSAEAIVNFTFDARPADFGAYAPRVVQAAAAGDAEGQRLMQAGANYIAAGLRALGHRDGELICLAGGVARHYLRYLDPALSAGVAESQGSALDGALELARRFALTLGQEAT